MFTGLIEAVGTVRALRRSGASAVLEVALGPIEAELSLGESVAVDGACLTASALSGETAGFDVSRETLLRTTLGALKPGDRVNVERALRAGARLGGHFVLGHVDGCGTIARLNEAPGQITLGVSAPPEIIARLVPKGSVAVSGISLTVASLAADRFEVALIPHTWRNTALPFKRAGDAVNLELDVIGKYVERFMTLRAPEAGRGAAVTEGFLREQGFL